MANARFGIIYEVRIMRKGNASYNLVGTYKVKSNAEETVKYYNALDWVEKAIIEEVEYSF